ncbi:MAG: OprO/OprP family phosphate-selective porin [Bacteroidales bacterium]
MLLLLIIGTQAYSQRLIHGKVTSEFGIPIENVKVRISEDYEVADLTNSLGEFKIQIDAGFVGSLEFAHRDYQTRVLPIPETDSMHIRLESQIRINEYGQRVSRISMTAEIRDGFLVLESIDERFRMWFDNRVSIDGAVYLGDNDEIGNGVDIRRARFAVKAILWKKWGGEIDLDFSGNRMRLRDAYVRYFFKNGILKFGNHKEPFSIGRTSTSRYISIMERPMMTELAPSRHIGLSVNKHGQHFFAQGGVFFNQINNGLIREQNKDYGTDEGISVTGRLAWMPVQEIDKLIHFGAAGSYRTPKVPEKGDPVNSFRYNTQAETFINRKKYVDTDFIEETDFSTLLGFEFAAMKNNLKFTAEYARQDFNRKEGYENAGIHGWYAMAGWLLTGDQYSYSNIEGEFTQIRFRDINKGAMEMAVRYSYMDANDFDAGITGGAAEIVTLGMNYYMNYNIKLMLNLSWVNQDRYADGRGQFDTDPLKPTGEAGIDFGMIQLRTEINF